MVSGSHRPAGSTWGLFGRSVRVSASGRVPRPEGQGRTVEGAVGSLAELSLFNLTAKISALLAEYLAPAYNNHHLLTSYLSKAWNEACHDLFHLNLQYLYLIGAITSPILTDRKSRLRAAKQFVHSHTAGMCGPGVRSRLGRFQSLGHSLLQCCSSALNWGHSVLFLLVLCIWRISNCCTPSSFPFPCLHYVPLPFFQLSVSFLG